jgi:hypothetical protein
MYWKTIVVTTMLVVSVTPTAAFLSEVFLVKNVVARDWS